MTQPPEDGCGRNLLGIATATSPQWVYVFRDPEPKHLRGTIRDAKPMWTDYSLVHDSMDAAMFVEPHAGYEGYLGTANSAPEERDRLRDVLEVEWEQRAWPYFAWPTIHDEVEVMGSWIWDCGHWDPNGLVSTDPLALVPGTQPGEQVVGERTEIHPPRMFVVHRTTPTTAPEGGRVADVLISSEGTIARAIADHAAGVCQHPTWHDCSRWTAVNDRDYHIFVPAPADGSGPVRATVVDQGSVNAPEPVLTTVEAGVLVTVPFAGWGQTGDRMVFAKRIVVQRDPAPMDHVLVRFTSLEWLADMEGTPSNPCLPIAPCTGATQVSHGANEVNLHVDVLGQWRDLTQPGMLRAEPGDVFQLDDEVVLHLAPGSLIHLRGVARECDQDGLQECAAALELGSNDDVGRFHLDLGSAAEAVGTHVAEGTSAQCEEATGGGPCYRLHFTVEPVEAPVATGADGGLGVPALAPWLVVAAALAVATSVRRPRDRAR